MPPPSKFVGQFKVDEQYIHLLKDIENNGHEHVDRTGVGRKSVYGRQMRFDLTDGKLALLNTKQVYTKTAIKELLWFISGSTNIQSLQKENCHIWDEWATENGEIGPMYGYTWRHIGKDGVDQFSELIKNLKDYPYSSRHIVSAWIPSLIGYENVTPQQNVTRGYGALAPCHCMFQCFVTEQEGSQHLSLCLYLRSADVPVGTPFNIFQYSVLVHLLAREVGMQASELIVNFGDAHIYSNQHDGVAEQINRYTQSQDLNCPQPWIDIQSEADIFHLQHNDIIIQDYKPLGKIDFGDIAV